MELDAPEIMYSHVQINEHELNTIGRILAPDTTFNCVQARLRIFRYGSASYIIRHNHWHKLDSSLRMTAIVLNVYSVEM